MKKTIFISILIAAFGTKSFAHCPIPQWCPDAPLHQILCSGEQIEEIEFPSVMGRTLFLEWWSDGTRHISVGTPEGISVSGTTTDHREYGHPVAISGRPTAPGTHHYTVSDVCGRILLSGSITAGDVPKFTIQPDTAGLVTTQDIAFCPDTLSVTLTGSAPIMFQWYYTTAPDTVTGRTEFGASTPLGDQEYGSAAIPITIVSPTLPNDEIGTRYYHVTATNICGTVKSDISGMRQVTPPPLPAQGCDLATGSRDSVTITSASFATAQTWPVGDQIWSDAVISPQCTPRGDLYNGGSAGSYNVDCRASINGSGVHYFSWCAVMKYAHILCPGDWRVPTRQDFIDLDILLGGDGENRSVGSGENGFTGTGSDQKYTGTVAGTWGGSRFTASASTLSGAGSPYWSSSELSATNAFYLDYNASSVYPQLNTNKNGGFALRCVRDVP